MLESKDKETLCTGEKQVVRPHKTAVNA